MSPSAVSRNAAVEAASSALEASVSKYVDRSRRRIFKRHGGMYPSISVKLAMERAEADARATANHAAHVLRQLTAKRNAFALGTRALRRCSDECCAALGRGIAADVQCRGAETGRAAAKSALESVLSHWFSRYIRLRDGLVLMQSGECRHVGDSVAASMSGELASAFGKLAERGDGYTKLYSSEKGYSGYGWDEFFDPDVGVRRRLLDALLSFNGVSDKKKSDEMRNNNWEKLGSGAELFESALDEHETALKASANELEEVRSDFLHKVNAILLERQRKAVSGSSGGAGRISMTTKDKFEKLELLNAGALGIAEMTISRQADDFLIHDKGGALPSEWDAERWYEAVRFCVSYKTKPAQSGNSSVKKTISSRELARKRRKVLEDSSDEEVLVDSDSFTHVKETKSVSQSQKGLKSIQEKKPQSGQVGLKIQAKSKVRETTADPSDSGSSLNAIKKSLGVDVTELQRGREGLENEEQKSAEVACAEEAEAAGLGKLMFSAEGETDPAELTALLDDIASEREAVRDDKRRLSNANKSGEILDVYNARYCWWESMMVLGKLLLELSSKISDSSPKVSFLKEAETLFRDSIEAIQAQELLLPGLSTCLNGDEWSEVKRTLLLLRGRADANMGIVLIDQALTDNFGTLHPGDKKAALLSAIEYLKKATNSAETLRACQGAIPGGASSDGEVESLQAVALESIACRYHGMAFWHLGRNMDSMKMILRATGPASTDVDCLVQDAPAKDATSHFDEVLEERANIWMDFYGAAMLLVELAAGAVEKSPNCPRLLSSESERSFDRGDGFMKYAVLGCKRAAVASDKIMRLESAMRISVAIQERRARYGIKSRSEIESRIVELEDWWRARKNSRPAENRGKIHTPHPRAATRGDISHSGTGLQKNEPTERITLGKAPAKGTRSRVSRQRSRTGLPGNLGSDVMDRIQRLALDGPMDQANSSETAIISPVYTKWGDELVPRKTSVDGNTSTLLAYPASCPDEIPEW